MGPTGAGLIAMGLTCFFIAFLGWWGDRGSFQGDPTPGSVAERSREFAAMAAAREAQLNARLARPLAGIGAIGVLVGTALVVID